MCQYCTIIPLDVLERLSKDKKFSAETRKGLSDTAAVDRQFRKIREQSRKLAIAAKSIAAPSVAVAAPAIPVHNCNHSTSLPGPLVANPANSSDVDVKTTYKTTKSVAEFYKTVFGRNSIDNAGMALISSVHYGNRYNNAFWDGSQMVYGDGDGQLFGHFCRGVDVDGHELTHGVTQYTLGLAYSGDAGGLNEGISDVFGSMFRQWLKKQTVNRADWLIGKEIIGTQAKKQGYTCLRNMANPADPKALGGPQITNYSQMTSGLDPHYSSGVPNFAFYKMAKYIGGKSWEYAGQIWYSVLTTSGHKPNLKMKAFADLTRNKARQLYPNKPSIYSAVDKAWTEVGL